MLIDEASVILVDLVIQLGECSISGIILELTEIILEMGASYTLHELVDFLPLWNG